MQDLLNIYDFDKVYGEIYKITNTVTNKVYIGQTRSHRLNHKKYRPFGHMGRFKDHIHEAYSTKKNISRYLNASILKHGPEKFTCDLIHICKVSDLDEREKEYIIEYNSKFPNGYNLTDGGRGFSHIKVDTVDPPPRPPTVKRLGFKKSEETKKLMSQRNKEACADINIRKNRMVSAQSQHMAQKLEKFKNVTVDKNNIDRHIFIRKDNKNNYEYVKVKIGKAATSFVGKYESMDILKERARNFIKDIIELQDTLMLETP